MATAAYYRAWRAAHPDYRARERERRKARTARMTPEERRRDRGARKSRAASAPVEIPPLHTGHDIFDQAKRIARHTSSFQYLTHPYHDDLISEIALALLEGRSAIQARWDFLRAEYSWKNRMLQLRDETEIHDGRLIYRS